MDRENYDQLTGQIIQCAIEVHRVLGPGLLESIYELCLIQELKKLNLQVKNQVPIPVIYKGTKLDKQFRADLIVEEKVIVELKCVDAINALHEVQLVSYLKLANKKLGLLLNFNVSLMRNGIRRKINGHL